MKNLSQPINITITAGTILKAILIVLLIQFLFYIKTIVLILLTSIVIASAIDPVARWLNGYKIPRTLGVLIIYIFLILIFAGISIAFIPGLVSDINVILSNIPNYLDKISLSSNSESQIIDDGSLKYWQSWQQIVDNLNVYAGGDVVQGIQERLSGLAGGFISLISTFFGGILSFVLIVVLSFYLSVQEDGIASFLKIVTPLKHEKYVIDLWKRSQRKIALWMQGQLILGVLIGVLTYLGLSILGVPNALFLALLAAIFELIPLFGPILAAIPAVGIGLLDGGITKGLLVTGLYVIIQQFESQLIHPLVVKKIVGIPAIIAILSLIIGGQIAGFLGIILSVPVAAAIMEYFNDLEKRKAVELKETEG